MLSAPSEIHSEIGIWVWRDAVDPSLASDFGAESLELIERIRQGDPLPVEEVYSWGTLAHTITEAEWPATSKMLRLLGRTTAGYGVNFIHYPAGVADTFHPDGYGIVDAVQSTSGRVLDVAPGTWTPPEAERNFVTVEVTAQDIVRQWRPRTLHRGRNIGETSCMVAAVRRLPAFVERFGPRFS